MSDPEVIVLSDDDEDVDMEVAKVTNGSAESSSRQADVKEEERLDGESEEYEEDTNEPATFEVEKLLDVRNSKKGLQFLVQWGGHTLAEATWEGEANFIGRECKQMVAQFKAANKQKIEDFKKSDEAKRKARKTAAKNYFYQETPDPDVNPLAPRELTETDKFYGQEVTELQGETKKLFDPSHLQTETDLILATYSAGGQRSSRSKTALLLREAQGEESRSRSLTPATPEPPVKTSMQSKAKGRGRKKAHQQPQLDYSTDEKLDDSMEVDSVSTNDSQPVQQEKPKKKNRVKKKDDDFIVFDDEASDYKDDSVEIIPKVEPKRKRGRKPGQKRAFIEEDTSTVDDSSMPSSSAHSVSHSPSPKPPDDFFAGRNDDVDTTWFRKMKICEGSPNDLIGPCLRAAISYEKLHDTSTNALISAVFHQDISTVQRLLNVIHPSEVNRAILNWREPKTQKSILQHLVCVTPKHRLGCTPSNEWIAKLLIKKCPYDLIIMHDNTGSMPIHNAVARGKMEIVRFLLYSGSPVNRRNAQGSPLDIAIAAQNREMIRLLIENGATFHHIVVPPMRRRLLRPTIEVIDEMFHTLQTELIRARRTMLSNITEIGQACPPILFARLDVPYNTVLSSHEFFFKADPLENNKQGFLLILMNVMYHKVARRWIVQGSAPRLSGAPSLNGVECRHAHSASMPMAFHVAPVAGINKLDLLLSHMSWTLSPCIAVQVIRYRLEEIINYRYTPQWPPLEKAPLVGPM